MRGNNRQRFDKFELLGNALDLAIERAIGKIAERVNRSAVLAAVLRRFLMFCIACAVISALWGGYAHFPFWNSAPYEGIPWPLALIFFAGLVALIIRPPKGALKIPRHWFQSIVHQSQQVRHHGQPASTSTARSSASARSAKAASATGSTRAGASRYRITVDAEAHRVVDELLASTAQAGSPDATVQPDKSAEAGESEQRQRQRRRVARLGDDGELVYDDETARDNHDHDQQAARRRRGSARRES